MLRIFTLSLVLIVGLSPLISKTLYVAKTGDDNNPGSFEEPFETLAKACYRLDAGDTLLIREGRYMETIQLPRPGSAGNPIVIMAYPGEKVVISALESLAGWELDEGSVYKTTVGWDLGQQNFVMYGDTACDLARWPNNTDGDMFTLNSLRNSGGSAAEVIYNAYLDYSGGIPDFDWSQGGSVFFFGDSPGSGWIAWKCFIKSNTSTRLNFDLVKNPDWIRTFHAPADLGDFYLEGIREVLDYQNEWYFNESTKVLYLQLPGGVKPADNEVFMRKRTYTINLGSHDYIIVKNLEVFGGSIEVKGDHNYLYGIKSRWGNHHRGIISNSFLAGTQSLLLNGSNNIVEKCDIGYGAATGVKLSGSYNKVLNSYIHNFNLLGSYDAPVMARDGSSSTLSHCTVTRGGRDGVHMSNNNSVMSYNNVSRSNMIADDCALFYCVGGPHNITIHHNWFHDNYGRGKLKKAAGIYLDNNPNAFTVHHNVIWNTEWASIQMNLDAKNIDIYNNTFWDASDAIGTWHREGTSFEDVVCWNNLANNSGWDSQSDNENNLSVSADPFVNSGQHNWQLKPGTEPVDYGRTIAGITDGFVGSRPDAGAYESGAITWVAGIDWDPKLGPDVCLEEEIYEEVDGILVVEAESAAIVGKEWLISADESAMGGNCLEYTGVDEDAGVVDSVITTYRMKISNPGTYRIMVLSRNGSSWFHAEADDFYGMENGSKHAMDTAFASLAAPETGTWSWEALGEYEGTDSLKLYASFLYSGIYTLSVAGFSSGYLIDRIVLFQEGREGLATDSSAQESWTGCDDYSIPNPMASSVQTSVEFRDEEIEIDGIMDEEWSFLPENSLQYLLTAGDMPLETDLSGFFSLSFSDSALFLVANVRDDVLLDESIDLFINPDNAHQSLGLFGDDALHLRLFYGKDDSVQIGNGNWKAVDFKGFRCVSMETGDGYTLEARIPWKGIYPMDFGSKSTTYMGFELQVNDSDPGSLKKLSWANDTEVDLAMYDTRKFGSMVLKKDMETLPVRVSGIEIGQDTLVLDLWQITKLSAQVLPENADNRTFSWQTDDPFILQLVSSTGLLKTKYPGTARIIATTQEGGFTDTCVVVVLDPNSPVGMEQSPGENNPQFSLYPNPGSEKIRLSFSEPNIAINQISVMDLTGRTVLRLSNPKQAGELVLLDISFLNRGFYLVRAETDRASFTSTFIKE